MLSLEPKEEYLDFGENEYTIKDIPFDYLQNKRKIKLLMYKGSDEIREYDLWCEIFDESGKPKTGEKVKFSEGQYGFDEIDSHTDKAKELRSVESINQADLRGKTAGQDEKQEKKKVDYDKYEELQKKNEELKQKIDSYESKIEELNEKLSTISDKYNEHIQNKKKTEEENKNLNAQIVELNERYKSRIEEMRNDFVELTKYNTSLEEKIKQNKQKIEEENSLPQTISSDIEENIEKLETRINEFNRNKSGDTNRYLALFNEFYKWYINGVPAWFEKVINAVTKEADSEIMEIIDTLRESTGKLTNSIEEYEKKLFEYLLQENIDVDFINESINNLIDGSLKYSLKTIRDKLFRLVELNKIGKPGALMMISYLTYFSDKFNPGNELNEENI